MVVEVQECAPRNRTSRLLAVPGRAQSSIMLHSRDNFDEHFEQPSLSRSIGFIILKESNGQVDWPFLGEYKCLQPLPPQRLAHREHVCTKSEESCCLRR